MGLFHNKYPYTDFHELNLDWIITKFKEMLDRLDALEAWKEEVDTWRDGIDAWQTTINNWKSSIDSWKTSISTTVQNIINGTQAIDISNNTSITNIEDDIADIISGETPVPSTYELPTATASRLGGIKVGSGLAVTADGTLRATGGGGGGELEVTNVFTSNVQITMDNDETVGIDYLLIEVSSGLVYVYYSGSLPAITDRCRGIAYETASLPAWAKPANGYAGRIKDKSETTSIVQELTTYAELGAVSCSIDFRVGAEHELGFLAYKNASSAEPSDNDRYISGCFSYVTLADPE